jgi:hypothetical protein
MIVATITVLMIYFGGGGGLSFEKAFEPFLKEAIDDKSRYEQSAQLTVGADDAIEQFRKEISEVWADEMKTLITDYDTTDDQFREFFRTSTASRIALQQRLLDIRYEMATIVTRDEWDAVYRMMDQKTAEDGK